MGVYMVIIKVPRTPPSLNVLLRAHWRKRKVEQGIWDSHLYAEWLKAGKFVFLNPVRVHYIVRLPATQKRDLDNYIGGTKLINDAIKRTFLTRDDSQWITGLSLAFEVGPEETEIHIKEV